jgi:hypothetical protein
VTETSPLPAVLSADTARHRLDEIEVEIKKAEMATAFVIGGFLAEARDINSRAGYRGGFEGWCKDKLGYSVPTAYRIIQVFENYGDQSLIYERLSQNALLEMVSAPADLKQQIEGEVAAGKTFTAAEVKAIKLEYERQNQREIEAKVTDLTTEAERLRALVDQSATDQSIAEDERDAASKQLEKAERERDRTKAELDKLKKKLKSDAETKEPPPPAVPPAPVSALTHLLDLVVLELMPLRAGHIEDRLKELTDELRRRMETSST